MHELDFKYLPDMEISAGSLQTHVEIAKSMCNVLIADGKEKVCVREGMLGS